MLDLRKEDIQIYFFQNKCTEVTLTRIYIKDGDFIKIEISSSKDKGKWTEPTIQLHNTKLKCTHRRYINDIVQSTIKRFEELIKDETKYFL